MFKTPEYQNLLTAERVMIKTLEENAVKPSERSQCARALVDIIQLKRNMRGDPNPKPIEVERKRKPAEEGAAPGWRPAVVRKAKQAPAPAPEAPKPSEPPFKPLSHNIN